MVETVKGRFEGSVFSIKKGTSLSDLIPCLKLSRNPFFAKMA
jgi:hypothetical protein